MRHKSPKEDSFVDLEKFRKNIGVVERVENPINPMCCLILKIYKELSF